MKIKIGEKIKTNGLEYEILDVEKFSKTFWLRLLDPVSNTETYLALQQSWQTKLLPLEYHQNNSGFFALEQIKRYCVHGF